LLNNYKDRDQLVFENVAISNKNGFRNFYYIKENSDSLLTLCDQIGPFDLSLLLRLKDKIPDIENNIVAEKLPCVTLNSILQKHKVGHMDWLQIDAEGFDYEIIKTLDFTIFKPSIIRYENLHLNSRDYKECIDYLEERGYIVIWFGCDSVSCLIPKKYG